MAAMANGQPVLTIGLLWHSVNSGNLGVGALTLGSIALLRRACAEVARTPRFIILGFADPGQPAYVHGDDIDVVPIDARAMLPGGKYDAALKRCDLVVDIGGGDSWTDIYSNKRFAFLWWSKWRAVQLGKPVVMAPQTIGPFTRPVHKWLASAVMRRAALVVARDPASFAAATAMAPQANVHEAVDVAFAMPFQAWPKQGRMPVIGINVSGLLFNRGYDGRSSFGMQIDYADYSRKLLATLTQRTDLRVELVAHVNSDGMPVDDDGRVAAQLRIEFPGIAAFHRFASPVEAKSCIASLDFLVAGRMHACIAAFSTGVAVLPVAYSRKFSGLFEGVLGYPHGVPVKGVTTDEAVAMTLDAIERRSELAAATRAGRDLALARLDSYSALLAAELARLPGAK
jgi:colanic acid/amylovoran biosynthesis protein